MLWSQKDKIKSSDSVIERLQKMGKRVCLVTSSGSRTRPELVEYAKRFNVTVVEADVISSAHATAQYLKQMDFQQLAYVIGEWGISKELTAVGIRNFGCGPDLQTEDDLKAAVHLEEDVGAIIVGFDEHISFPKLAKAIAYLTRPNTTLFGIWPDEEYLMPGAAAILKALEHTTHRTAKVIGKPYGILLDVACKQEPIGDPARCLMIGDQLNVDILFGNNCGFRTLLVGSGKHQLHNVQEVVALIERGEKAVALQNQIPEFYIKRLGKLLDKH